MNVYEQEMFEQRFADETNRYRLPGLYRKFYNNRVVDMKDWNLEAEEKGAAVDRSLEEILTDDNMHLPEMIRNNESDLAIVKAIADKSIDVKSFDFDGEKYDRASASLIIEKLEQEISMQQEKLVALDKRIYRLLCHRALGKGLNNAEDIRDCVAQYRNLSAVTEAFHALHNTIVETISPFYQAGLAIEIVNNRVAILRNDLEIKLKARLREMLEDAALSSKLSNELQEKMQTYISKQYYYFMDGQFHNEDLDAIYGICREVSDTLTELRFQGYKTMLVKQAEVIGE